MVSAAMYSGGGSKRGLDPALDPLRSRLISEGWATTSDSAELVRTWPTATDPQSLFDELFRVYVTAYAVQPRHLWAAVFNDEPWTAALPYMVLYAVVFVACRP